ncbi:hypothetical protein VHEMI09487 [[Torrubiella] hemipterigena]|uniref:Gastric mucin-like protein n=1 Tax=[Torrubiella] hemipterigena TaxID=1531966 RepID=A0A0A1TRK0_9HYPO|nr:hypothetical protein VHEMI09487 [[Torrubiella] hemipterigena]
MERDGIGAKGSFGNIIAVEGRHQLVSTQLQLLPHSPQILVLPSIEAYLDYDELRQPSKPRTHLTRIRDALTKRNEEAAEFIRGASRVDKRLVFLVGGSATAQTLCLKALMKYETEGNRQDAEAILRTLFDGHTRRSSSKVQGISVIAAKPRKRIEKPEPKDPILKAMLAADALDRKTADLQESTDLDLTLPGRSRSLSLPILGFSEDDNSDGEGEMTPVPMPKKEPPPVPSKKASDSTLKRPTFAVINYDSPSNVASDKDHVDIDPAQGPSERPSIHLTVTTSGDAVSPMSDAFSIATSDGIEYGQASVLNLNDTPIEETDGLGSMLEPGHLTDGPRTAPTIGSKSESKRPMSCILVTDNVDPRSSRLQSIDQPRTILVKSKQPVVRISPVPKSKKKPSISEGGERRPKRRSSATQRFPCFADLVLYLSEGTSDDILETALGICRSSVALPTHPSPNGSPTLSKRESCKTPSPSGIPRPPTPVQTPPPADEGRHKFHHMSVLDTQTPVAIQNSIRSVLSTYFPPHSQGYRQCPFHFLPDLDEFWQPIFGDEVDSDATESRSLKQILAISRDPDVSKERSSRLFKLLECSATKGSQTGRCTRLDLRYLMATTIQAFKPQPHSTHTLDDPFRNPVLLAILILPQLERYLSVHSDIRYLLLEHSPQHLPTVLALQKLAGLDFVKVAQVVNAIDDNKSPFKQLDLVDPANLDDNKSVMSIHSSLAAYSDDSTSNANYLINATASVDDVSDFAGVIWNLNDTSQRPSSKQAKQASMRKAERSASRRDLAPPRQTRHPIRFPSGIVGLSTFFASSPVPTNGPPSPTPSLPESIHTARRSLRVRPSQRPFHKRSVTDDGLSLSNFDLYEEESDYDIEEERRLMPLFMHQKPRTVDTRKALKFLGIE